MGTTGDMKNNLRKLQGELKLIKYSEEVDYEKMMVGLCAPFLPLLHYVFTEYSPQLSAYFSSKGYDLYAKSDLRFLEIIYKILVTEMDTKPMLTKQQFFAIGYAEMKVIFTTKIVSLCRLKLESLTKKTKKKKRTSVSSVSKALASSDENGNQQTSSVSNQSSRSSSVASVASVASGSDDKETEKASVVTSHPVPPKKSETVCPIIPNQEQRYQHDQQRNQQQQQQHHVLQQAPRFQPPLPNPVLALTPIKSNSKLNSRRECEGQDVDLHSLDLTDDIEDTMATEVGEESFVETNDVEIIDPDEVETIRAALPQFKVTKHSVSHLAKGPSPSSAAYIPTLPGNITVDSSRECSANETACVQCEQCLTNSKSIETLVQKQQVMENDIYNLVSVNNDLSAKVVLLETKLKLMGSSYSEKRGSESTDTAVVSNELSSNVQDADDEANSDSVVANQYSEEMVRSRHASKLLNKRTAAISSAAPIAPNTYSPIKYTDDDIIIKDFKPIRMKDVYEMLQKESDDDKENASPHDQPKMTTGVLDRKNLVVVGESQPQNAFRGNHPSVGAGDDNSTTADTLERDLSNAGCSTKTFSDSCDVSLLFDDDATEEAVINVRKKLQETENMLRNSGNYFAN